MTSRDRIKAAWTGQTYDYAPLTTWCFGLPAKPDLKWASNGVDRDYWYSLRMEHIHSLPQEWTLEDDFKRASAWLEMGVDDILDLSVPWSVAPDVEILDKSVPGADGADAEVLVGAILERLPEPQGDFLGAVDADVLLDQIDLVADVVPIPQVAGALDDLVHTLGAMESAEAHAEARAAVVAGGDLGPDHGAVGAGRIGGEEVFADLIEAVAVGAIAGEGE